MADQAHRATRYAPGRPAEDLHHSLGRDQQLHQRELEYLSQLYDAASLNSGQKARLLDIISPQLDRRQVARLVRLQGFERLYSSILRTAPLNAQYAIDALHGPTKGDSTGPVAAAGFNENPLDYTVKEIYLSYKTAPKGSYSVPAAMYETANFVGLRLAGAFGAGYTVGTVIQQTWQTVSPTTWDRFSDFVGSSIDGFVRAAGSIMGSTPYSGISDSMHYQIGALQEDLWSGFPDAGPRGWYTGGGDFGVTASWQRNDRRGDCK